MENLLHEVAVDTKSSFEDYFRILADEIASTLRQEGVFVRPYTANLTHFSALPPAQKQRVLNLLGFYRDLCIEHIEDGYKIKDSKSFTWRALQKLGLTPTSDLFSRILDDDVIEIYSSENVQLFRNFRFFELCSYSLEELYSVAWWYLFEREETVGPKLISEVMKIIKGEIRHGFRPDVDPHVIVESQSEEKLVIDYDVKWVAPVMAENTIEGFVAIERGTLRIKSN